MSDTPNPTPSEPTPAAPAAPSAPTPPASNDAELAALRAQLADTAKEVLAAVPDHLRDLIPANLSPADQIAWFRKASATGVFDKPAIPATPTITPAITPTTPDTSGLPVHARMAAGYAK